MRKKSFEKLLKQAILLDAEKQGLLLPPERLPIPEEAQARFNAALGDGQKRSNAGIDIAAEPVRTSVHTKRQKWLRYGLRFAATAAVIVGIFFVGRFFYNMKGGIAPQAPEPGAVAEMPVEQPAEQPPEMPAEQPAEQPAEEPTATEAPTEAPTGQDPAAVQLKSLDGTWVMADEPSTLPYTFELVFEDNDKVTVNASYSGQSATMDFTYIFVDNEIHLYMESYEVYPDGSVVKEKEEYYLFVSGGVITYDPETDSLMVPNEEGGQTRLIRKEG